MRHVLSALFALGCGSSTAVAPDPSAPSSASGETSPRVDAERVTADEVVLDARGEGAAHALRYRPVVGRRQSVRTVMEVRATSSTPGAPPRESATPPFAFDTETHVTEVAADGSFRVESRIVALNVGGDPDDPEVRAYRVRIAPLTELAGWTLLDARGRVLDHELTGPDDPGTELEPVVEHVRETLRLLLPVLPEEPVAPGARWHCEAPMRANGVTVVQRTSYALRERDDELFGLDVEIERSASPQPAPDPTSGPTTQLVAMTSRGGGVLGLRHDGQLVGATIGLDTELRTRTSQEPRERTARVVVTTMTTPL